MKIDDLGIGDPSTPLRDLSLKINSTSQNRTIVIR